MVGSWRSGADTAGVSGISRIVLSCILLLANNITSFQTKTFALCTLLHPTVSQLREQIPLHRATVNAASNIKTIDICDNFTCNRSTSTSSKDPRSSRQRLLHVGTNMQSPMLGSSVLETELRRGHVEG